MTIPESPFQGRVGGRGGADAARRGTDSGFPNCITGSKTARIGCRGGRSSPGWPTMTDRLLNIDSTGIGGPANVVGDNFSAYDDRMKASRLRAAVGWLPTVVILAAGVCLLPFLTGRQQAATRPMAIALAESTAITTGLAKEFPFNSKAAPFDPSVIEAIVPEQPAPVDGLRISSQSWRRGGLGSNAFVTMTLRNNNEYAVKNIDISCAFTRPDGSHLTDRNRLISDAINMKSRKTFVRLHVGFVNVNATRAKCSLLAASHI